MVLFECVFYNYDKESFIDDSFIGCVLLVVLLPWYSHSLYSVIPYDSRTLCARADTAMISKHESRIRTLRLRAHNLAQQQDFIDIHICNAGDAIQSILLDERLDRPMLLATPSDLLHSYCDENRKAIRMPEIYQERLWRETLKNIPPGRIRYW